MARAVRFNRRNAVIRLSRRLRAESYPRIQMALLVALTGAIGLLCSYVLLSAGLHGMAIRYALSLCVAYLGFLFLLWLWLRTSFGDYLDLPGSLASSKPGGHQAFSGEGGGFGGGGASGSFDAPANELPAKTDSAGSVVGDVSGAIDFDADEFALPLVVVALAVGLTVASLYVVYTAPVLFAELLVDAGLSYSLYRRLRKNESKHWLVTAIKRTVVPFAATGLFLVSMGYAMSMYAPGAKSIGEVMNHAQGQE